LVEVKETKNMVTPEHTQYQQKGVTQAPVSSKEPLLPPIILLSFISVETKKL